MGKQSDLSCLDCQKFAKKLFAFFSSQLSHLIIETVGAIFREYKPWIVLLITQ
jgi:hypothetical protein